MRRVGLRLLECGRCRHPEAMTRQGAGLGLATFPSLVGLIRHPTEGLVLFDTGYDPAFLAATEAFPERLYRWATPVRLRPGESVAEQLGRMGLAPADVSAVVLSHFHGDHAAGLRRFPQARLFCARAGLADLRSRGRLSRVRRGLLADLVPEGAERRATFFEDLPPADLPPEFAPFDRAADLFGDGSLLAVELPGHCPGHWGLALRLEDDRPAFLIADAAWSLAAVEQGSPPPRVTTALLGRTGPYRETLARLSRLHRRASGVVMVPSHCAVAAERFGRGDGG